MTFGETLKKHDLSLRRSSTTTLQVNVGLGCDLACRHCHQQAGPARPERMSEETAAAVIACAQRFGFETADITGGAPELFPGLPRLVAALAQTTKKVIVRTNLTALARPESQGLPELYRRYGVVIAASLPAVNPEQTEAQRGSGVWDTSLAMLRRLNDLGYGREGSGLELILVANPSGAFLAPPQAQAEQKFRNDLARRHGIAFSRLFTLANVPLGRFRSWLEASGNLAGYLAKLEAGFNPCAVEGLMCRSLISVDWDGYLYDCDFNLAAGRPLAGTRQHIAELRELPRPGSPIALADYCYTCTAGAGSSCSGSTV
jgi:radical SAM/Cys-rich protein